MPTPTATPHNPAAKATAARRAGLATRTVRSTNAVSAAANSSRTICQPGDPSWAVM